MRPGATALRVLQLTTDLRLAGAERVVITLARGLRERGVECAVAGIFEGGEERGRARAILESDGFDVYCAGLERKWRLWRLAGLRRFALDWRPNVLHCHMFHGNAAGVLLRATGLGAPIVWTHHVCERRRLPARNAFYRLAGRVPEVNVHVSEAVQRFQRGIGGAGRQEAVIHNGIEQAAFRAVSAAGGRVFGALGMLTRQKGFDVLVRAFGRLAQQDPGAELRIGGSGPEEGRLRELVRSLGMEGRVSLVGFVDDVPAFLSGLGVFVNPSRWEGFGLTLLEAMAAGLPCIASRVDSLPEVGGDCVRWVPPEDEGALCAAMRDALSAPHTAEDVARQRGRAARFSAAAMVERYLALYRSLAGVRGRPV